MVQPLEPRCSWSIVLLRWLTGLPSTPSSSQWWYERNPGQCVHPAASSEAGCPGEGGLTSRSASKPDHAPPGQILLVTVVFFSKDVSKSSRLKASQSKTFCFNSQKPLGFVQFCLHLSSFSVVAETPKTQINKPTT